MAHLVGTSSHRLQCHGFDSWSGHIPWLGVPSWLGCIQEGSLSMFLSHTDVLLSVSLLFSKSNERMCLGEDKKNNYLRFFICIKIALLYKGINNINDINEIVNGT